MSDDIEEICAEDILEASPSVSPMAMNIPLPIEAPQLRGSDDGLAELLLAQRKLRLRTIVKAALGASVAIIALATLRTGVEAATAPSRAAAADTRAATDLPPPAPPPPVTAAAVVQAPPPPAPVAVPPCTATAGRAARGRKSGPTSGTPCATPPSTARVLKAAR